jgi:hypothetical protein
MARGRVQPVQLLARVSGDPAASAPRLRPVVTAVEPAMILDNPVRLDHLFNDVLDRPGSAARRSR